MGQTVTCPYCGTVMYNRLEIHNAYATVFTSFFECAKCDAQSPHITMKANPEEIKEHARGATLKRHEPPLKPLTWEEAIEDDYYLERVGDEYVDVALNLLATSTISPDTPAPFDCIYFRTHDEDNFKLMRADYGKTWRCWSRRPTPEERAANPWEV